ncbi:Beta-lactamase [Frankliniella fusca]|uniref:Beta-lactamase n=1 Tax=Frankliniella fusca TaxID=407009 RepID=A0AAE1LMI4_9NEOP|nr:Beta-lactamase [Frankliniella fusca]
MAHLTRREVFAIFSEKAGSSTTIKISHVTKTILQRFSTQDKDEEEWAEILRRLCYEFVRRAKKSMRLDDPKSSHSAWLDEKIHLPPIKLPPGRPTSDFDSLTEDRKRKRAKVLGGESSANELAYAAMIKARSEGRKDIAHLLCEIFQNGKAQQISEAYLNEIKREPVRVFTANEALALMLNMDISRDSYQSLRNGLVKRNHPELLPPYKAVHDASEKCSPSDSAFILTESAVQINIQALLDITLARMLEIDDVKKGIAPK